MKNLLKVLTLASLVLAGSSAKAQNWDQEKFPDYRPGNFNPDPRCVEFGKQFTEAERTGLCPEMRMKRDAARRAKRRAEGEQSARPDHVDNGATKFFAPVFNQDGGSCGSASRICYMFTHELNAFRNLDGSKPENYYPSHFVWLHTYGQSGKDEFVQFVGVPNAKTYGGQTYSKLFGYNDESDPDFGWMNGYDKWFSGFRNRMHKPTTNAYSLATEVGREWAKNWLWNHCGDTDFKTGGLIGLGVASGGQWRQIPKTAANDKAGVTGKYFVKEWGVSVDHALTMVGYDDRIEFDLDGNGVYGEVDKDEVGAWIIVNSWGASWNNGGFVYCPYAFAGATFNNDGDAGKRTFNTNSWWYGELYNVRKNYEPKRTIKVKMDYSHRSELCLSVGVSDNLNATKPDKQMNLHHFIWAGDGNYGNGIKEQTGVDSKGKPTYKDTYYAPEVPMLGKWADGKMHEEPMEFGYDLTDLCADYDSSKPLKLFFMIDSRTKNGSTYARGNGHIYHLSIMDYAEDENGVETLFDLGETGVAEVPCKKQLTWSTIVYGNQVYAPINLTLTNGALQWGAPQKTGSAVAAYRIYKDNTLIGTTSDRTYTTSGDGTYGVSALYENGKESSMVTIATPLRRQEKNVAVEFNQGNGFTIPDVFADTYPKATIEYWIRPKSLVNWNNSVGEWNKFMIHCDAQGCLYAGWAANDRVQTSAGKLKVGEWSHVALTINNASLTAYVNGTSAGSRTSTSFSGIGGFGNLIFNNNAGNNGYQDCVYDEIRIWSTNHSATNIKNEMDVEFSGDIVPDGLLAYYKGDIIYINGWPYLRDCVGGHHAKLATDDATTYKQIDSDKTLADGLATGSFGITNVKVTSPTGTIYAGVPATFTGAYPDYTAHMEWNCPEANINKVQSKAVSIIFPKAGTYAVTFTASNADGSASYTKTVNANVVDAPAPDAEFTATSKTIAAGENVTFAPVNPSPVNSYEWSMPGARVETSSNMITAANYEVKGTYTVTLTVSDVKGNKVSKSQQITVSEVAPEASFAISNAVPMKGETIVLENTSKYNPTSLQWILQGSTSNLVINGGTTKFECDKPGIYDVTLIASNEAGTGRTTQQHALVVVNADSKNGLSFSQQTAKVKFSSSPLPVDQKLYSFDWWMNPSKLTNSCWGIGDNDSNFQIRVITGGKLTISNKGKISTSPEDFIIPGQWHHYAVTVGGSLGTTVKFYRDGVQFTATGTIASKFAAPENFSIGTTAADMNGSIDELRIWNKTLTIDEIKAYANEPIADPKNTDGLVLYYDFNQSGGDVQDRSANGNTGIREGFGPDGDAWGLSRGVFCLNFDANANAATDVTKTYLKNYKRSFSYDKNTLVNTTTPSRFYGINNWILENQTVEKKTVDTKDADGNETSKELEITTGIHVDAQKSYDFTCTTGWDHFGRLTDHKAFQILDLEPGLYNLTIKEGQHGPAGDTYLVAAQGNTLPNGERLAEDAIAYAPLSDRSLTFIVPEQQTVSLGVLVASMGGNSIFTIQEFKLTHANLEIREAEEPTGIDATLTGNATTGISRTYDLQGRSYGHASLRPGAYIINGKKTILK